MNHSYFHVTHLDVSSRNIILLHNENLAPRLYATFKNGLAYEYVPGVTLTTETVIDPKIYALVAAKMAQLHLVKTGNNNSGEPMLWNKLEQFYNLIPDEFSDVNKQERFVLHAAIYKYFILITYISVVDLNL